MDKLVLIGGGGHCKSVLNSALRMNSFSEIVITDPALPKGSNILGCKVVGSDDMLPVLKHNGFDLAFITVGSLKSAALRIKLAKAAAELGFRFPVIADPTASVSKHVQIGAGTFIGCNAVINADVQIGEHCIINTGAIVEHECKVGDFTHISVGAVLCGNVCVGSDSLIGAGSTVIQGVHVGNNVIAGANSTVLADVEDNIMTYGVNKHLFRGG